MNNRLIFHGMCKWGLASMALSLPVLFLALFVNIPFLFTPFIMMFGGGAALCAIGMTALLFNDR